MNRFKPKEHFEIRSIWILFSVVFVCVFCIFMLKGIYNIDHSTLEEQTSSLEKAIRRSVVQCYVVEGTYPPSLDYLVEHYGITYDPDQYYVDYTSIGSNLMPDITIIPLNQE